jgi:hypothetical protein
MLDEFAAQHGQHPQLNISRPLPDHFYTKYLSAKGFDIKGLDAASMGTRKRSISDLEDYINRIYEHKIRFVIKGSSDAEE